MSDIGTTPALYAALPTIQIDGQDEDDLSANLIALLVEETTAGLYRCEATFRNFGTRSSGADYLYFDRQLLDFGKPFAVRAGAGEAEATIFSGRIMALEAQFLTMTPPELVVLAEDRFQDLRMTRRSRSFENVSDSDVVSAIAGQYNLQTDIDIDGPTYPVLTQLNQSDLAFLRERARAVDAEAWLEAETLHVQARSRREADSVTLTYREGLIEFQVLADLAHQRSSVTVGGWDVAAKTAIAAESTASAIQPELNGYRSGAAILADAIGPRHERIVHQAPFSNDEAQHLAQAYYRTAARRFVTGQGVCAGNGRLRVGTRITLRGLGPLFNGDYTVTSVRHTFDDNGFQTRFAVERPGIGA
ncbi:MAG: phage late control D family protein [Ardenticatenaceae bacterium]|nr:phage late control D family protein [Ardenticatenaceae bacterium]